jgi:hypothetical protein
VYNHDTFMSENPIFLLFRNKEHERHKQFARLREKVQWKMALKLHERMQNNPQYTPEEKSLGVYLEQLEPQVREAVLEFNRKGYRTTSSGFSGAFSHGQYDVEHQEISGKFFIDDETKQKLAAMGVVVTTESSWTWEMDRKLGVADQNTPREASLLLGQAQPGEQCECREAQEWADRQRQQVAPGSPRRMCARRGPHERDVSRHQISPVCQSERQATGGGHGRAPDFGGRLLHHP